MASAISFQTNFAPGGCYFPPPCPAPCPGPWNPRPWGWNENYGNLPNANVGQHGWLGQTQGYALDLNRDGRYERGRDGVLAMDLNRDGRITPNEIQESRERLKAMGGNFDLNGDGNTTICERSKGARYQREMRQNDENGDGVLSAGEFARAGGRVLVDRNRDGRFDEGESFSPFQFPTGGFGRGRLNYIDPFSGSTSVHRTPGNPWGPYFG